jgi:hypothetical protein
MIFHSYRHSTTRFVGFSIARNVWTIRMDINEMMGLEWKNVGRSNSFTFCMGYPLVNSHIAVENQHVLMGKSTISMAIFQFANCKRLPGRVVCSWKSPGDSTGISQNLMEAYTGEWAVLR